MTALSFDAAAAPYDRFMGRWSRLWIPALLAAARIAPGQRVMDVATGTGEAALAAAAAVGPAGRVLGSDLSLPMLRAAGPKAAGTSIGLLAMDAQALACRDESVDAVICQLGLMFFPDPAKALQEFRRVLRPGGWMAACVWSAAERTPFVGIFLETMARHVPDKGPELRAGVSLGDSRRLRDLVVGAGLRDVSVSAQTRAIVFESFEDYWEPVAAGGGRAGVLYGTLPEAARGAVKAEVRGRMAAYETGGRLLMSAEALVVAGRK